MKIIFSNFRIFISTVPEKLVPFIKYRSLNEWADHAPFIKQAGMSSAQPQAEAASLKFWLVYV